MTREEAIQVLQTALTAPFIYGEYADALNMAIEALTHEIHTETHDNDLISRMSKPISMEESLKDIEPWYEDDNLSEPMTSEELFKDLGIDDEAEVISRENTVTLNSPIIIQAEMVPVVRCKDCKYQDECEEVVLFDINDDEVMGHRVYWCSYGRREL